MNIQRVTESAPLFTVPTWLVSLAADAQPVVNVVVGVLTAISIILHLVWKYRERRK